MGVVPSLPKMRRTRCWPYYFASGEVDTYNRRDKRCQSAYNIDVFVTSLQRGTMSQPTFSFRHTHLSQIIQTWRTNKRVTWFQKFLTLKNLFDNLNWKVLILSAEPAEKKIQTKQIYATPPAANLTKFFWSNKALWWQKILHISRLIGAILRFSLDRFIPPCFCQNAMAAWNERKMAQKRKQNKINISANEYL